MPRRVWDYAEVFASWHSIISAGHFLTVLSVIIFGLMLGDSCLERRPAGVKFLGINRLNTRLTFVNYEVRKRQVCTQSAQGLAREGINTVSLFRVCHQLEVANIVYTFEYRGVSGVRSGSLH